MTPERESWRRWLANVRNNLPADAYRRLLHAIDEDVRAEFLSAGTIPMPPPIESHESCPPTA